MNTVEGAMYCTVSCMRISSCHHALKRSFHFCMFKVSVCLSDNEGNTVLHFFAAQTAAHNEKGANLKSSQSRKAYLLEAATN